MKKKLLFPLIIFVSAIFLVLTLSVSATVYRIINEEGKTIRVTTEPEMNIEEKKCRLYY